MGGLLSKPETTKRTLNGEGLGLRYGISSMQGWRPEMEDAHDIKVGLKYGLDDWSYFAVFDGHAGKRAAAYAAWNLLDFILRDSQFELELGQNWSGPVPVGCDGQIECDRELQEDGTIKHLTQKPYQPPDDEDKNESSNSPQDQPNGDLKSTLDTSNQKPKSQQTTIDSEPNDVSSTASPTAPTTTSAPTLSTPAPTPAEPTTAATNTTDSSISTTKSPEASTTALESESTPSTTTTTTTSSTQDGKAKSKFASLPVLEQLKIVENAIKSGFLTIDQNMRMPHLDSSKDSSGCTAVCALISPTHLFIANCGDSRAVLYRETGLKFATEDHKPSNPKERRRIVDAGGVATQRINGSLAVSRALGDFEFKKDELRGPCEQLVSPEPDVTVIERHPRDEFLIIACDGIWDVMENEELCQYVRHLLTVEEQLDKVCSSVLDNGPKVSVQEIAKQKQFDEILCETVEKLFVETTDRPSLMEELTFAGLTDLVEQLHRNDKEKPWPPGAGIEGKYNILRSEYDKQRKKRGISDDPDEPLALE